MNLDHFGMDTITLTGPLEAKLAAVREARFTQIMLNATDIVGHPGGEAAAVTAGEARPPRGTGLPGVRRLERPRGGPHASQVGVGQTMLGIFPALGSRRRPRV